MLAAFYVILLSGVAALHSAAFGGPVGEPLQLVAVLPGQLKEFGSGHVSGFLAQEGLKPPL